MSEVAVVDCVAEVVADTASLKVVFASMDGECVDQHFGSSLGFYVYSVTKDEVTLITSKAFPKEKKDGNEDKLKPKLLWLAGSDMVYCGSIGGSATKQLISLGVHPKVVKEGPDVEQLLEELQVELAGTPSPMLARILKNKQPKSEGRFDDIEDEWDE